MTGTVAQIPDWDDAYANAAHIPDGGDYPRRWSAAAAEFRAQHPPRRTGDSELYLPAGTPRGLAVFIHGGYWLAFGPAWFSHLARGPLERGWAVLLPAHTLAPHASLDQMRHEVAAQIAQAAEVVDGPIVLTGHSAGGHLAARLICDDSPLLAAAQARVARCLPISGLFDLRPLQRTAMRDDLGLDDATASAESPVFHVPLAGPDLHVWVGAAERPVFLQQSRLIHAAWGGIPRSTRLSVEPGRHHMNVIDGLTDAAHPMTAALVGED